MKIIQGIVLCALLSLGFIACDRKARMMANENSDLKFESPKEEQKMALDTAASPTQGPQNTSIKNNLPPKVDWEKKIIKTANLNVEVADFNNFNLELHRKVKQFGGYVAQEEQNQSTYQVSNAIIIKVPVDQFDDAVSQLVAGSKKLIEKKIMTDDVTSEIIDTKSRMEARKQVRQRYLDLLRQAKNMKDILQVQNEINEIQEQIESADGRIGYLNHAAVFSTIHLNFFQIIADAPAQDQPTYIQQIKNAFKNGGVWVLELFIGLLNLWPLLILFLGVWIGFRRLRVVRVANKNSR